MEVITINYRGTKKSQVAVCFLVATLALLLIMPTIVNTQPTTRSSYRDSMISESHIAEDVPSTPVAPDMHRTYGDADYQVGISIAEASSGGYALLGYTRPSSTSDYDFWLIRTDFSGEVLWDKTFDRTTRDYANKIIETSDEGFVMLGTIDSDDGTTRVTWLVRTDANGDLLWDQVYDGPGTTADEAFGIVELDTGGFAFAGRARNLGLGDVWVVRTDASGGVVWSRTYGGPLRDEGYGIVLADDGNLVIAGYTENYGAGLADAWLLKLDAATGDGIWAKTIGSTEYDLARSVARSNNGDFILCGYTGVGGGASGTSIWLVRVDPDGDLIWEQEYTVEGAGHNTAVSVIETSRGNIAVTGYVGDNLLWLRTDSEGDLVAVDVFGGPSRDTGSQVIEFAPGSFVIIGYTRSFSVGTSEDVWLILLASPKKPQLKLSGEFDFLLKEEIHLQLAALLTDRNTGDPISYATVTYTVYDPDRNLILAGPLIEEISDSGVYVNRSTLTMKDMDLPKGIYLVYARAVTWDGFEAVDMIQFHIDPPSESESNSLLLVGFGSLAAIAFGFAGIQLGRRRMKMQLQGDQNTTENESPRG
ncbi:MAG: hypothetical protein ACFFER_12695 [Candidatus Thorarchaeota archaeon]